MRAAWVTAVAVVSATPAHPLQTLSGVIDHVVGGQFSGLAAVAGNAAAKP
jgi:hypothetical protein